MPVNHGVMSIQQIFYIFISSFIALFPVMNPVGSGFIVNSFFDGLDPGERNTVAKKVVFNCLMVGLGSLLAGHLVLLLFGLAVPVIQIGGGFIICRTALGWLSDSPHTPGHSKERTIRKLRLEDVQAEIFYPISFPISIGPGSISVIFTLMAGSAGDGFWETIVNYSLIGLAIVALCGILYLFLSQGSRIMTRLGASANLIINKMIAFITFCIGLQILVTGISKTFNIPAL